MMLPRQRMHSISLCALLTLTMLTQACTAAPDEVPKASAPAPTQALPAPQTTGGRPLLQVLNERRTVRDYDPSQPLTPQTLSNLLWAAFGINRPEAKGRTAPSAHGVQEISIYVVTRDGAWLYDAQAHQLQRVHDRDIRALTGKQGFVKDAPVNLVYVADWSKFTSDDDETKRFYSAADTGFISQNVYLFCTSEGLVTMVRAYIDQPALAQALHLTPNQHIVLAQSVGYPKR